MRLAASRENGPVNLGNPEEMTILEFARRILAATGSPGPVVHVPAMVDDPRVRRPDIGKARGLLGWEPRTGLEEGLSRTIGDFRERIAAGAAARKGT